MGNDMKIVTAKFKVGQIIYHRLFEYRGVILDVDSRFSYSELWYSLMAKSQPSREQPWYHVLVNDSNHITYVAESNIICDTEGAPIRHPQLDEHFGQLKDGIYLSLIHI